MSLHALAGHMASKGRGTDSMLVHMTPEEVQSLQVLALKGGGTLTINPDTGLPEANFLKKMLPMIAGAALNFFAPGVGTAVGGMFGLGAAAGTGIAVGGLSALATGSLSRGLMAGMGAYGGASLAGGLANAGTGALSSEAGNAALANAGLTGEAALSPAADEIAQRAIGERLASATPFDKLSTGFKAVTESPAAFGNFAKNNYQAGLAMLSPMLAADTVQTTTKRPDTGMIRNYTFDPYGQTYSDAGSYPASEYKGMAQGGIVALAAGGDYRSLTKDSSAADIASAYKQFTTAGGGDTQVNRDAAIAFLGNIGIGQDKIGQAYTQFQAAPTYTDYTQQNVTDYLRSNPNIDIAAETAKLNANPLLVNQAISQLGAGFLDPTNTTAGSGSGQYFDAFTKAGIDANELFAANKALNPNDTTGLADLIRRFDVARQFDTFEYGKGGGNEIERDIGFLKQYDAGNFTGDRAQQIKDIARETGLSLNDAARRYDAAREAMKPKVVLPPPVITGGINQITGDLPGGVSGGGNTVLNSNGTITTAPNIPGRPAGGFTGMGQVRDVYTQGGGSLGYVNPAPKTMEEFNTRFNRQTGDSLAAYNYLMGKGANPIKSGAEQIMRPYSEAVMGVPVAEGRPTQKFIFDQATRRLVENPNYRPLSYNSKGERMVGLNRSEVIKGIQGLKDPADNGALFDFVTQNRISEAQLAAALGIPLVEARARLRAAAKAKGITNLSNIYDGGSDGFDAAGNNTASNNAPVESMGTDTGFGGDGAGAGAPGGGNAAGGPGNSGDGLTGDSSTAGESNIKRGGLVPRRMALGGLGALARGGAASQYNLGGYSDGGRLLRGPGDGVSDSIPATIGDKQPARLADGEFVVPARIVSELGNGSTEAGARKLYAMMDRVQKARGKTTGKKRVAANTRSDKYLPA